MKNYQIKRILKRSFSDWHLPQVLLGFGRLTLRARVIRKTTRAGFRARYVTLELVGFVLDGVEVGAARALGQILIV